MKLQIEPTEILTTIDGVECRVWNGVTEDDKQVFVFIHRIATREDLNSLFLPCCPETLELFDSQIRDEEERGVLSHR
jgi:hypothetical protein